MDLSSWKRVLGCIVRVLTVRPHNEQSACNGLGSCYLCTGQDLVGENRDSVAVLIDVACVRRPLQYASQQVFAQLPSPTKLVIPPSGLLIRSETVLKESWTESAA